MNRIFLPTTLLIVFSLFLASFSLLEETSLPTFQAIAKDDETKEDKKDLKSTFNTLENLTSQTSPDNIPSPTSPTISIGETQPQTNQGSDQSSRIEKIIEQAQKPLEAPVIQKPESGSKIKGKQVIEILAPDASSVDIGLQTSVGPAKAFHLGTVRSETPRFTFEWDSLNTPNWSYDLHVRANYSFHQSLVARSASVVVDNPIKEATEQKEAKQQVLEQLGLAEKPKAEAARQTTTTTNTATSTTTTSDKTATSSASTTTIPTTQNTTSKATQSNTQGTPKVELPESTNVEVVANTSTSLGFNPVNVSVEESVTVEKISNTTLNNKTALTLSGKALPNSIVTLYILSDPIVVTVKADANGNWTYTLDKTLVAGDHEVFVTVPKPDGSLVRSEVSLFAVAKAAGANQQEGLVLVADSGNKFQVFITYTVGLIMLAVVALLGLFLLRKPQVVEDVVD